MVTGVETAGLVLASLPIVVQVLTEYRSGLRKTLFILGKSKTYEIKIGRLARQLKTLHMNLQQVLTRVIGTAAPDEWSGNVLPRDYRSQIWTGESGKKIRTYLEEVEAFDTFETIIGDFENCLLDVAKSLSGLLATPVVCWRCGNSVPGEKRWLTRLARPIFETFELLSMLIMKVDVIFGFREGLNFL